MISKSIVLTITTKCLTVGQMARYKATQLLLPISLEGESRQSNAIQGMARHRKVSPHFSVAEAIIHEGYLSWSDAPICYLSPLVSIRVVPIRKDFSMQPVNRCSNDGLVPQHIAEATRKMFSHRDVIAEASDESAQDHFEVDAEDNNQT